MRHRFRNALRWYSHLVDVTHQRLRTAIENARRVVVPTMSAGTNDMLAMHPISRPTEYLRRRCPLCFGGLTCHDPNIMCVMILSHDCLG